MLIKSLFIENFRCYKSQIIDFEKITSILGRNGSGKTTIFSALEAFYDIRATIGDDDFYNHDTTLPIRIRVTFTGFRSGEERDTFSIYLQNDEMTVTKLITFTEGLIVQKYFASTKQITQFSNIRNISGKQNQVNTFNELAEKQELPGLEKIPGRGADVEAAMNNYEANHSDALVWCDREEQFFGARNVGGGRLDKFTKFIRVPAVRDVMDDVSDKKGSPIAQLLEIVVMRRIEAREDIRKFREEFEQRLLQVYSTDNLMEIKDLEVDINSTLKLLAPNAGIGLSWGAPRIPEIPYPTIISQLEEDGFSGAINRKGHGVQRALIFSLLQNLALVSKTRETDDNDMKIADAPTSPPDMKRSTTSTVPDYILAIDEPELYQHPLRSKHLAKVFRDMVNGESSSGGRNQIFYTTHSQYFVELRYFSEVRIVRKCQENGGADAPCSKVSKYSLSEAAQEMVRINDEQDEKKIGAYTEKSFLARSYPVMTTIVNEGFFADIVVLVEGMTEAAFLYTIAENLSIPWLEKGVAVVPVEGKSKLDRAGIIFKGLNIPTYIIFDGDISNKANKDKDKTIDSNKRLLRLVYAEPEDFPKDGAYNFYACFEDKIETYCRKELGDSFYNEMLQQISKEFGYEKPKEILKNYEASCEFVKAVYDKNKNFPLLEAMVKKIFQLTVT